MLKNWSNQEQPREKLIRHGAKSLSDGDLVKNRGQGL